MLTNVLERLAVKMQFASMSLEVTTVDAKKVLLEILLLIVCHWRHKVARIH